MKFLVLQHIACEHPGIFRHMLARDGISLHTVELDEGYEIPELEGYDALWVMGGPMDVWQEEENPWLVAEKRAIKHAVVDLKMPFLGLCLGHQLLAEALGGIVGPSQQPEIGILDVSLTEKGLGSPFFSGLEKTQKCLQWHSAEIIEQPDGIAVLATSPACAIQAMSYENHAFSMQYHIELEHDTVTNWGDIPAYKQALQKSLGADALSSLDQNAQQNMADFNRVAALLYKNFLLASQLG